MTVETLSMTDELRDYMLSILQPENPVLVKLRQETAGHPLRRMQISREQGQLMALLVRLMGARRIIEIGVFTGYSSLALALAIPPEGRIVACDVNDEYTTLAKRYWQEAGVAGKIDLRMGPAIGTLDKMIADGECEKYDFAFIDADKENDYAYYERLLRLLRPGGLIAVDNILWSGLVIKPEVNDEETIAIRRFNEKISSDTRVMLSVVPIGDGLTLALKL